MGKVHSPSLGTGIPKDGEYMYVAVCWIRWCLKTLKSRLRIDLLGWTLVLVAKEQNWDMNFCY